MIALVQCTHNNRRLLKKASTFLISAFVLSGLAACGDRRLPCEPRDVLATKKETTDLFPVPQAIPEGRSPKKLQVFLDYSASMRGFLPEQSAPDDEANMRQILQNLQSLQASEMPKNSNKDGGVANERKYNASYYAFGGVTATAPNVAICGDGATYSPSGAILRTRFPDNFEFCEFSANQFLSRAGNGRNYRANRTDIDTLLRNINIKESDSIDIVITDLFYNTNELPGGSITALSAAFQPILESGRAVAIVTLKSGFDGDIYDIPKNWENRKL
jgi:hypothetical protein